MEGAAPSRKEGRGPRRSSSFSGVVSGFPGLSRTTFTVPGEEEEVNSVQEEDSDGAEGVPAPVGKPKVLEDQLYPTLIGLSLISLNHPCWPLCSRGLKLWPIFKKLHLWNHKDHQPSRLHL
ncbi:hypothetical protein O181_065916 [Austropuccinia psidii MF-1]|uniref:Uncharacterized protein n=1 Tax=Austropuccinia psidii MF-1 TaxID=1389203 RepID=A0A9Q3EPW9_9BASI|nr:hypothetical protein [Austropuccinia psidii MF-1]